MTWTDTAIATIIVAAITTSGGIVVALINRKHQRTKTQVPAILDRVPESIPQAPRSLTVVLERDAAIKKNSDAQITEITHSAIAKHIMRVPPFQRGAIEDHYVGLRVRWLLKLCSISELSDGEVMLYGDLADTKQTVECVGKKDGFVSLIHAPEGSLVEVEGTIHKVSSAFTILHECRSRLA